MAKSQDPTINYGWLFFKKSEHVTLDEAPDLVLGRTCNALSRLVAFKPQSDYVFIPLENADIMKGSRVLITAYPPSKGMLCPIVVKCECEKVDCKGPGDSLILTDFPGMPFVRWADFQEGRYPWPLPKIFALIMPDPMNMAPIVYDCGCP